MSIWERHGVVRPWTVCFIIGFAIELFMLKVRIGKETFYETVVRKERQRRRERIIHQHSIIFPKNENAPRDVVQ